MFDYLCRLSRSDTMPSTQNTKSLQRVHSTNQGRVQLGLAGYYKYRAENLMFGFNAGILSQLRSFCNQPSNPSNHAHHVTYYNTTVDLPPCCYPEYLPYCYSSVGGSNHRPRLNPSLLQSHNGISAPPHSTKLVIERFTHGSFDE